MSPSCFSTKIDLSLARKLHTDLEEQGFTFTNPDHTIFSAKRKGVSLTLYKSGALTVQGKEKDEFIEFYLEPNILQDFSYTHPLSNTNLNARIGVDEAGKGDFFGPLCVAGLYADENGIKSLLELGVRDSKSMTDSTIRKMAKKIKESFAYKVIALFPSKYNELYARFSNLNRLLAWGHASVIDDLATQTGSPRAIIDQFAHQSVVEYALKQKNRSIELEQRHRGEEDPVVAGASILARTAFLEGMDLLSDEVGTTLPRGASKKVSEVGKNLVISHGEQILAKIAKTHFKTKEQILMDIRRG